jgi:hypothetical protein
MLGASKAPLFLLVAIDELGPEDFEVFEVPGLHVTATMGQVGYIAFAKSRCGNMACWKWMYLNHTLPFCNSIRQQYNFKVKYILK